MELYSHSQETLLFAHHPEAWMLVNAKSVDRFPAWPLVEVGRGTWLRHKLGVETFANFVCGSWEEENRWKLCHLHHSLDSDLHTCNVPTASSAENMVTDLEKTGSCLLSFSSHSDVQTCLHSRQALVHGKPRLFCTFLCQFVSSLALVKVQLLIPCLTINNRNAYLQALLYFA